MEINGMTNAEIREMLCDATVGETIQEVMKITGHKWLNESGGAYRVPRLEEIWKTVEFLIERIQDHAEYYIEGKKVTASFGGIQIECTLENHGIHAWELTFTAFSMYGRCK